MKKFIIFFYVAVSLLVMPLHCSAETYYKLPEETYLETMKFTSPITRMLIKCCIHLDTILTEDQARSYLNDIISGLKYCM